MNLTIQAGVTPQSSLLLVPLAELRQAYRRMRVAAKPIRRLVNNPNEVGKAVPPAVQVYLPAVNGLIAALRNIELMTSGSNKNSGTVGEWIARMADQHKAAEATVSAAISAQNAGSSACKSLSADLQSDSYQAYAALFNTCVDAYHEVVEGRQSQHQTFTEPITNSKGQRQTATFH